MRWMDVTTHTSEMKKFFARSTVNVLKRGALASTSTPVEVASKASTALSSMSVVLLTPTMRNTSTGTLVLPQHPRLLVQSVDDSDLRSGLDIGYGIGYGHNANEVCSDKSTKSNKRFGAV